MWHHNKKNPMAVNTPKAPAKPATANKTAQSYPKPSPMTSTIKVGSPEIRIGLDGASRRSGMLGKDMLKPTTPKKTIMNIIKPKGLKMTKVSKIKSK